jgi:hypothetical protein
MFDSTIPIEKYWKGVRQDFKTNLFNCSTIRDENILPTLGKEQDDDAIATQTDREAAVETDAKLT